MNKVVIYILCLVYSASPLAQSAINDGGSGTAIAPPTGPNVITNGGTVVAPKALPPAPTSTINQGANTGQQAENNGSGANNAAGAALIAAGTPMLANPTTMPMGMALIAMGILALMQGGSDSGDAGQSGNTAATSALAGSATPEGSPTGPASATDNGALAAFSTPAGQQALAAVQAAGGNITGSTVTMPDGSTVPLSSFSSPGAMTAAGFNGAAAAKILADVEKKLGVGAGGASGLALAEGSGGGGVANTFGKEMEQFKLPKFNNPFDLSKEQKAQMLAGKTVSMGGDPIGVSGDDLFAMVHRAYVRKSSTDDFISNASGGETPSVSVRAPASIIRKPK